MSIEESSITLSQEYQDYLRRDPEEEYFRLSVLSLKMQYNERDSDFFHQINSTDLYKLCKNKQI